MPNVKLFVDEAQYPARRQDLVAILPDLRALCCRLLDVTPAACQIAVIPVLALADQPQLNAELNLLARDSRTPDSLRAAAAEVQGWLAAATGLSVAVRITSLDPAGYVVLK